VIGIIEGIGQLIHPIIGFTVSIETNSHSNTEKSKGEKIKLIVIIRPSQRCTCRNPQRDFHRSGTPVIQRFTLLYDFY